MSEYATNGAMLVCTCGAAPTPLTVVANMAVMAQGNAVATVSDKIPMENIMPFGVCKLKPSISGFLPCVPAPTAWTGFNTTVKVPGGNPLLKSSTIQCGTGGMIQFQDSGQMAPKKVVISPTSLQIETLKKAAISGMPFCEECEMRKAKKAKKNDEELIEQKAKLFDAYWFDENGVKQYDVIPDVVVDLHLETIDYVPNEKFTVTLKCEEGKVFKDGEGEREVSGVLNDEGVLIVKNFEIKYKDE